MRFVKYQGLGNDYLVMEARELKAPLTPELIRRICDRHYGVGSDGIIVRQSEKDKGTFSIHIFNPDGSWAEKSGNGLRIFSRYLWDRGEVGEAPFKVETPGGTVTCQVLDEGRRVTVEIGRAVFDSASIPATGPPREILREILEVGGQTLEVSAVSMGNPHCVVHRGHVSEEEARFLGPLVENHPLFPRRTNVQFMENLDRKNIKIEIWERGAGYTLASGTSSCAVSAVAYRLDLCDDEVTVHMPGGELRIEIGDGFQMRLTGLVGKVMEGEIGEELGGKIE
jgi:diaminopimelate epimerase